MNAPAKRTFYYMIKCTNGTVMYEHGTSVEDVQGFMERSYSHLTVESIQLVDAVTLEEIK